MRATTLAATALLLLLTGCSSGDGGDDPTTTPTRGATTDATAPPTTPTDEGDGDDPAGEESLAELDGEWRLVEGDGLALTADDEVTFAFDAATGKVSGSAGCNRYTTEALVQYGLVAFGQIGSTKMACPEPRATLERDFLKTLERIDTAERDGDQLVLSVGQRQLRFDPVA